MPDQPPSLQDETVRGFFALMNREGVDYAVLRNYEDFPRFGHDVDLVVRWRDIPKWRAIARSCAQSYGWEVLTECDHWARSSTREHTIQVLRFYTTYPLQYLQIDSFHSLVALGFPLFDEDRLLESRIMDDRGFYRIDANVENIFRLLQIAKLAGRPGAEAKLDRYKDRVLSYWDSSSDFGVSTCSLRLGRLSKLYDDLRSCDYLSLQKTINRQKHLWLMKMLFSRPLHTAKMLFDRVMDYLRLFALRPCGFDLYAFVRDEKQNARLKDVLQRLTEANTITHYTFSKSFSERRTVRERGGIVIHRTSADRADIFVDDEKDEDNILGQILRLIIERHQAIFDQRKVTN
ncbi:MAG: hypothetical protein WCA21_11635 [Terracidiphilus sp.]